MTDRIGLFGGTFDPVHNGHLALARAALDTVQLTRLLFVPAACPPHKKEGPEASFADRTRMIDLAIASETRMSQSTVEAEREGPSYTVETLRALAQKLGQDVEIHLVVGADSATAGCSSRADSISKGPTRCPPVLITSSSRPTNQ